SNPTRKALEKNLASLEKARFGLCYASGCSAEAAVLHLLKAGDHVVLCDDVYGGTNRLFHHVFNKAGIEVTLVDMTDLDAFDGAFRDSTKVVWLETPTNPTLKIIDIARVAERAHAKDAMVCAALGALVAAGAGVGADAAPESSNAGPAPPGGPDAASGPFPPPQAATTSAMTTKTATIDASFRIGFLLV
ncbi:MAG: aminotransferase class I/II-fold pyridoxal phosphate-dependent enzyme, partial [Chloroflexi bacterium]|nr:aminotransferase class I/II-fold pyridoxal phosphate-dependent enzyme [Chloroflexota bacterium]